MGVEEWGGALGNGTEKFITNMGSDQYVVVLLRLDKMGFEKWEL